MISKTSSRLPTRHEHYCARGRISRDDLSGGYARGFFSLRIGVADAAFDGFLLRYAAAERRLASDGDAGSDAGICWGLVTVYNPGRLLSDGENRLRQGRLRERIIVSGWRFLEACNVADAAAWPEEPSYLLLHAHRRRLCALGREFDQLAVVYGCTGSAPELLWL